MLQTQLTVTLSPGSHEGQLMLTPPMRVGAAQHYRYLPSELLWRLRAKGLLAYEHNVSWISKGITGFCLVTHCLKG